MCAAATSAQVPEPEVQVWGRQRRLLCQDEDEVLRGVHGGYQGRQSPLHLRRVLWRRKFISSHLSWRLIIRREGEGEKIIREDREDHREERG